MKLHALLPILFFISTFTTFAQSTDRTSDTTTTLFLFDFYVDYIQVANITNSEEFVTKRNALLKAHVSKSLRRKMGKSDYDMLLNAQDADMSMLDKLGVIKEGEDEHGGEICTVSYYWFDDAEPTLITVIVVQTKKGYMIDKIL